MRVSIEIPKEFEADFRSDGFKDALHRLAADANCLAGNYEVEVANMLADAFEKTRDANIWVRLDKMNEQKEVDDVER